MPRPVDEYSPPTTVKRWYATNGDPIGRFSFTSYIENERHHNSSITPGWKTMSPAERKRAPPLAYTVQHFKRSGVPYVYADYYGPGGSWWIKESYSSAVVKCFFPSVSHVEQAYTLARARAAKSVNEMQMNVGQFFGERKQLANLLADTTVRIASLARALRRVDPEGVYSAIGASHRGGGSLTEKQLKRWKQTPEDKRISNHWLELQYGWKPLLQDVHGAARLFASHVSSHRYQGEVRSSGKGREVLRTTSYYSDADTRRETRVKMAMRYELDSYARASLAQTGIDNPALLAWELLPYSFVVDWFLPVGDYLEALNAFSGFSFKDGWISKMTKQVCLVSFNRAGLPDGQGGFINSSGAAWEQADRYDRIALHTWPDIGKQNFRCPLGGDPLERFATAYSLIRVLFK